MNRPTQIGAIGAAAVGTGAAVTAGVASACCVGPALAPIFLAVLGSGGLIAVSTLRPYAPWMLLGAAVMLTFSFRQTYHQQPCTVDGTPAPKPVSLRVARAVTWIAAALWVLATAYAVYGLLNE